MPEDTPIAYTAEGRPLYDNAETVVAVIIENSRGEVLAIRRAKAPGIGKLAFPGGFQMRESWRRAGVREVAEETSVVLDPKRLDFLEMETDEFGHNVVIARYMDPVDQTPEPQDGEAQECLWISRRAIWKEEWAFPMHHQALREYFVHYQMCREDVAAE